VAACAVVGLLYKYIEFQKVKVQWGDGTRGLQYQRARNALLQLEKLTSVHVKNWRPQVLLFAKVAADKEMHQPGLLCALAELKGSRGISIISTAIEGELEKEAGEQREVEAKLRHHRDTNGIAGFTQVVMTRDTSTALDSLLQTAGLGGLGPNTVMTAWPTSWKERIAGAERMMRILTSAHAFNMALILIKGHEAWQTKILPSPEVHRKPVDIWWVVHDGGLLLLLSVILRKHRKWSLCPLRMFVVCNKDDDVEKLTSVVSTFLYNMRISAQLKVLRLTDTENALNNILSTRGADWGDGRHAKVNSAIVATPLGSAAVGTQYDDGAPVTFVGEEVQAVEVKSHHAEEPPEAALPPKMRTTRAFNRLMRKHSSDSSLVMTNLPLPKVGASIEDYMEHLDAMMDCIPRALLVAGQKDADVITMYS